ncbi:hypothetical protein [Geobacter sp.]|uniref:hypothetical protein n=1 Tax=Geobacter sp. TaxID=46610 RepID=UPI002634D3B0|nr:hypothetical protein [Geobacter sp.]
MAAGRFAVICGLVLALLLPAGAGAGGGRAALLQEARYGFEEILDLWRDGRYDRLYDRTTGDIERGRFVEQLLYASRIPACCWEKLRDVTVSWAGEGKVSLTATLGMEVEGVGTRFVTRSFLLVRDRGVWKVPAGDILSLAEPNMQRIPREIPERTLP